MTDTKMSLPVIDMAKARNPALRPQVAKQVVCALETVGFLFLDNVEGFEAQRLLNAARWFFALSDGHKQHVTRRRWNPRSHNHYRGYFPLQPDEVSYKEGFEIGQEVAGDVFSVAEDHNVQRDPVLPLHPFFAEHNQWPVTADGAEEFRRVMLDYYQAVLRCGSDILQLVSLGCGLKEDWFQTMFFPHSLSTLRLLHYPPRQGALPAVARDGDTVLCCSEHSDSGFVTLLATFDYAGLQIRREDGEWMDVPCRPSSLVMNIGDMLATMSGGRFKATCHRVVDTGINRFSVPFFLEPHNHADISHMMPMCADSSVAVAKGWSSELRYYGPWLIEKMRSFAEYREILDSFTASLQPNKFL